MVFTTVPPRFCGLVVPDQTHQLLSYSFCAERLLSALLVFFTSAFADKLIKCWHSFPFFRGVDYITFAKRSLL